MTALRALRKERGVKQQKMADYLGITRQAYSNYEAGRRSPDNETLFKLAEYFDVSVDFLLRGMLPGETPQSDIFRRNAGDCLAAHGVADIADSGAGERLTQILDGHNPVTLEDAFEVADMLGEPICVLLGADDPPEVKPTPAPEASALAEMGQLFHSLTPEQAALLFKAAERLLEAVRTKADAE